MKHVVIIGGGISGLATAHRLWELGKARAPVFRVTLLEAQGQWGGVIGTERREGFLFEKGPDAFISEKPWALELCRRLGLEEEVIGTRNEFRQSFIYLRGKLRPVPNGFYLIAPCRLSVLRETSLLTLSGKLRMLCDLWIPPKRKGGDESVASFVRRRLGPEALERVGQPMVAGIYSADPERLSLEATFPRFLELEARYGSVLRGLQASWQGRRPAEGEPSGPRYSLFLTLKEGMERLVQGLVTRMTGVNLRSSARVVRIEKGNRWRIFLEAGESLEADLLCLALPAPRAARLVRSFSSEIASDLEKIRCESVATVNLAFRRASVSHPLNGFGFVIPASEKKSLIGCTFSSVKFPGRVPEGTVLLRAFVGGALHREILSQTDGDLVRTITEDLQHILGISGPPLGTAVHRFPESMPQYDVGHLHRVASIEEKLKAWPGLFITGNAYRGIGIPDCIREGERAAEAMNACLKGSS